MIAQIYELLHQNPMDYITIEKNKNKWIYNDRVNLTNNLKMIQVVFSGANLESIFLFKSILLYNVLHSPHTPITI